MQRSLAADIVRFAKAQRSSGGITFSFLILIHTLKYSSTCASFWSDPDLPCSLPHFLRIPLCIMKHRETRNKTKIWEKELDKNLVTVISPASGEYPVALAGAMKLEFVQYFKNILCIPQSRTALWVDLEYKVIHKMDDLDHDRFYNTDVHHCHSLLAFSPFLNV